MDCVIKGNYFEQKFTTLTDNGFSIDDSAIEVIEVYLSGKPVKSKKQKSVNNNQLFWSSKFLWDLSDNVLKSEAFTLALAKYFTIDNCSNFSLLESLAHKAPNVVRKGLRCSELVLRPNSRKWIEAKQLAERVPNALHELINICKAFQRAHNDRLELVAKHHEPFKALTVFELLSYSSVYAFKYLFDNPDALDGSVISTDERFRALKKLVEWKLSIAEPNSFTLTDSVIGKSLKRHQSPLVFPSQDDSSIPEFYLYHFEKLMQAQVELDGFLSRSVTPFCFDDECEYYFDGDQLGMHNHSDVSHQVWLLNGKKQSLIDGYWLNRGLQEFIDRGLAGGMIGSAENHEDNQTAYIKSLGAYLQLSEIYGLNKSVQTDNGLKVDIHQALLSLELMIAFYNKDYIEVFAQNLHKTGDWQVSLGLLALSGLIDPANMQNRFPITWQNWKQKAQNIVGWTVSDTFPKGNIKAAEAILDFWTLDFKKWSAQLKANNHENLPQLTERPIFKIGHYSVQLPWMMANQLTNVNVINTLRRFANKRSELHSETSRIETNLGNQFRKRGFTVIESYHPERTEGFNPGEIDLICVLDNTVLVLEVKSTYRRNSKREVLRYKHTTLRKAGQQIKSKTEAVKSLLETDETFRELIGIKNPGDPNVIGWIADTSLEYDHEYFNGFLKVSVEELHIALRDEAEMLVDFMEELNVKQDLVKETQSLYPTGFSAKGFVEVITLSKLWAAKLN
ncbi:hypothetical protein [Psychromonas sp.]|uniref:hypothetical protein n=1 Tax=Psychromonas sp. TaxID=1884585 RepID=UPI0035653A9B